MSYFEFDQSDQNANPVHLYQFTVNETTYRFTDISENYTAMGEAWQTTGLISGSVRTTNEFIKDTLQIKFPRTNTFAQSFLDSSFSDSQTTVTVFRGYIADPDEEFISYWKGRVAGSAVDKNLIILDCEPVFTTLKRTGVRARYQRTCRHALYSSQCGVDIESSSFMVDGTVTAVDGVTFTISEASAQSDGYYFGGVLRLENGDMRFIINHTSDQITLNSGHPDLAVSSNVTLFPGCDRSPTTCQSRFNNLDNFGGFPYIPEKNPFNGSSVV